MNRDIETIDRGEWATLTALGLAGIGITIGSPILVAAATMPLWYVGAVLLASEPPDSVEIDRSFSGTDPAGDPGERVTVTVTVENTGPEPLVDLRVVDGVPETLAVVDGEPTLATTLSPGETAAFEYTVEQRRGDHRFQAATVRNSGLSGARCRTWEVPVEGESALSCLPAVESVPLGNSSNDYAGDVPTDEGGTGVEFHSVREYEPGDPVSSIDWRRYANNRELATVEFRAERSNRSVCVLDGRSSQFEAPTDSTLSAVELSVHAARRTFETLVDAGHPTGIVRIRSSDFDVAEPGTDATTRARATKLLSYPFATDQRTYYYSWRESNPAESQPALLPGEAQVFLFSSFTDDVPVRIVETLRARGYEVRVVSPDITDGDQLATRVESLGRRTRLERARRVGAHVVDWNRDEKLDLLLRQTVGVAAR